VECVICWVLLCRVGIELPTIEVRYENLEIDADCFVGGRALPTLSNSFLNIMGVRTTSIKMPEISLYGLVLVFFSRKVL
jgi:hypothetical protein